MFKIYSKLFIFLFLFVSFVNASSDKYNQQIFELKTSQEFAQKLNDEKTILIMGQLIQKENEIKDLQKQIKDLEIKNKERKEEISSYNNIINRQDKRIEDLNHYFFWYGILITILLFGVSYVSYKFTSNHAKDIVYDWLAKNKNEILEPIRKEANELQSNIEEKALNLYLEQLKEYNIDHKLDESQKETIKKVMSILEKKEKEEYSYNDWYLKFIDVNNKGDKRKAELYINKALKLASNDIERSRGLFQKAYLFDTLIKDEKVALDIYDEIIETFLNSKDHDVLKIVITSMNNKAVILFKEKEYEKRLKIQQKILNKFEDNQDISIQEIVARNSLGIGWYYSYTNTNDKAIEIYNHIISKYKNFSGKMSLNVRDALLNKFEINLIENKTFKDEDINLFEKISDNTNSISESLIFEFQKILELAKESNQDIRVKNWEQKIGIELLPNIWDFEPLKNWANTFNDSEVKNRLLKYINVFSKYTKRK